MSMPAAGFGGIKRLMHRHFHQGGQQFSAFGHARALEKRLLLPRGEGADHGEGGDQGVVGGIVDGRPVGVDVLEAEIGLNGAGQTRADLLLELELRKPGYGPSLRPTKNARAMVERYGETVDRARSDIQFVAAHAGDLHVTELERLGTALYVTRRKKPDEPPEIQAEEIVRLKPHISPEQARDALETIRSWQRELPSA